MSEESVTLSPLFDVNLARRPSLVREKLLSKGLVSPLRDENQQTMLCLLKGDSSIVLLTLPTETVDLIMISPPYANQGKNYFSRSNCY